MYQPRAYPPRQSEYAGYKSGSHDLRKSEQLAATKDIASAPSATNTRVESVRSRPPSTSRHRSHSSPRSSSNMYSSDGSVTEERQEEVSQAQLQEMRDKSKALRDQVLTVQRTVQSKEGQLQRLRNERLPSEEVTQEADRLSRLQDRINVQESRLRKLRETKTKIQQQVIINSAMSAELDGLKNIVNNKEKEIGEMDQLINQLNTRLQQAKVERNNRNSKNSHYTNRIEKLKQEMMAHKRITETVQGKFSSQREAVQSKKDEMKKVDLQISELWRKLQQAKAAQQQSSQKSATAIAAVGPFEHKPSSTSYPDVDNRAPTPTKPQEIDIKLIERNGGSGQSSPSISADEREPYSMRTVKPPPPLSSVTSQSPETVREPPQEVKSALSRVRTQDGVWSAQNKQSNSSGQVERRHSPSDMSGRSEMRGSPVSMSRLPNDAQSEQTNQQQFTGRRGDVPVQKPTNSSPRVSSPDPKVSSPRNGSTGEVKLEKGPVRQLSQPKHLPLTHSLSDPSITTSKPKNFNAKPRPFGNVSTDSSPSADSSPTLSNRVPPMTATDSANLPRDSASAFEPPNKRDGNKHMQDNFAPPKVYPAAPIMGRQQLHSGNSLTGNGAAQRLDKSEPRAAPPVDGSSHQKSRDNPSQLNGHRMPQESASQRHTNSLPEKLQQKPSDQPKVQSARYATRSQISDTYMQQVDRDKLEQYRKDMEKAVRDISLNKQENTTGAEEKPLPAASTDIPKSTTSSTPAVSTPAPSVDVPAPEDSSPSLTVLAPNEVVNSVTPETTSSEDERSDHVEIYNPTENQKTQVKSIIKRRSEDRPDGLVRADNARFHPLVILLDTALNGTVDEVQHVLPKVPDPSASNDEGITALHNAICAGHLDIVQTLVEFGVDVNAVDTDGWTPLHCAASCNNQPVVEYLISRGACILATTYSDSETALEKCEMNEEGYDGTSKCLHNMEMKLGVDEPVYCVYNYTAESTDELSLHVNDKLTIIRRGDKVEKNWWWAKCGDNEGYVAKNLLAFTPRVLPGQ